MATRKDPAAVALGRKGGKANTPAQDAARRENGKRGGRPPKMCSCGITITNHSPGKLADCRAAERRR